MDTATRLNRGILGINAQFYIGGEICVCPLGLIELQTSHTSQNLCTEIMVILNEFNIKKKSKYTQ